MGICHSLGPKSAVFPHMQWGAVGISLHVTGAVGWAAWMGQQHSRVKDRDLGRPPRAEFHISVPCIATAVAQWFLLNSGGTRAHVLHIHSFRAHCREQHAFLSSKALLKQCRVCILKRYGHNLSVGEQPRWKQLQTFVCKLLSLEIGREYRFTRIPLGLRAFTFANSLFGTEFEKRPKPPTAPSKRDKGDVKSPFSGCFAI